MLQVFLHPSSILKEVSRFPSPYIVFQEKIKTSKLFIRNCTMVPTLALILFCKGSVNVQKYLDTFVLSLDDDWIALNIKDNQVSMSSGVFERGCGNRAFVLGTRCIAKGG